MSVFFLSFLMSVLRGCRVGWINRPVSLRFVLLVAFCLPLHRAVAKGEQTAKDEFSELVELAPFVVNGQSLAISIHARTKSDRRYGEQFAERVSKVVYEAVTESTGKGLVIIGAKGEPHPMLVLRKFLALSEAGKLDPAIAARAPEVSTILNGWQGMMAQGTPGEGGEDDDMDFDFDQIVTALPMPLAGMGAKLYQLAWREKFDERKVEAHLCALRPGDLERRELFRTFDWVFYLPPKGAFDRVFSEIIAAALKKEEVGFAGRTLIKTALLAVKPKIRRLIEALRQGLMFRTILDARTHYSEGEVSKLTEAYMQAYVPGEKATNGSDDERALAAVRDCLRQIDATANPTEDLSTSDANAPSS